MTLLLLFYVMWAGPITSLQLLCDYWCPPFLPHLLHLKVNCRIETFLKRPPSPNIKLLLNPQCPLPLTLNFLLAPSLCDFSLLLSYDLKRYTPHSIANVHLLILMNHIGGLWHIYLASCEKNYMCVQQQYTFLY